MLSLRVLDRDRPPNQEQNRDLNQDPAGNQSPRSCQVLGKSQKEKRNYKPKGSPEYTIYISRGEKSQNMKEKIRAKKERKNGKEQKMRSKVGEDNVPETGKNPDDGPHLHPQRDKAGKAVTREEEGAKIARKEKHGRKREEKI